MSGGAKFSDACAYFSAAWWIVTGDDVDPNEWFESSPTGELDHVWEGVRYADDHIRHLIEPAEVESLDNFRWWERELWM